MALLEVNSLLKPKSMIGKKNQQCIFFLVISVVFVFSLCFLEAVDHSFAIVAVERNTFLDVISQLDAFTAESRRRHVKDVLFLAFFLAFFLLFLSMFLLCFPKSEFVVFV